jgi:hypothetical protein
MAARNSALLLLMALGLFSCSQNANLKPSQESLFDTRLNPATQCFSLAKTENGLDLVFADRGSLALVSARILIDSSSDQPFALGATTYLDRVSDMPGNDPLFGSHVYYSDGPQRYLLYLDRKSDERELLKLISWGPEGGKATIDVLPFTGRPVAILRGDDGVLEVYFEEGHRLRRQSLQPAAVEETLRGSFSPAGTVSILESDRVHGFTAFDYLSHRLILFRRSGRSIDQTVIAHFGVVHFSTFAADGTVMCLAYDQQQSHIVLFQQDQAGPGFHVQPVAPARDVRCLGMLVYRGLDFFLFSEQTDPRSGGASYRLSMLVPQPGARNPGYRRVILRQDSSPVTCFRTVMSADSLYVAWLQGSVQFLRLDLKDYLRKESD